MSYKRTTQLYKKRPLDHAPSPTAVPRNSRPIPPPLQETHKKTPPESTAKKEKNVVAIRAPTRGTPWDKYQEVYEILDFEGAVSVATGNGQSVHVRKFSGSDAERAAQNYLQLRHDNIVKVLEEFDTLDIHYIVLEEMKLCLYHIVRCPGYPSELQLRSILVQMLEGLLFLHRKSLGFGGFTCKNVLINSQGLVKLANQENFKPLSSSVAALDTKSAGVVALNLMQKNNGPGVTDQERWAAFLGFVADAATQGSLIKLRSDPLFDADADERSLVALVVKAEVASQRAYKLVDGT